MRSLFEGILMCFIKSKVTFLSVILSSALLSACGGGGGGSSTGTLNVGLTDAPVENAAKVVVAFSGVEIKPKDGPALDPVPVDESNCDDYDDVEELCYIDLLTLTGSTRKTVFNGELPAGDYNCIRLLVEAEQDIIDSYIEFEDGTQCSLYIPSGSQTGLKIVSGITITANGVSDYTLDFDVKKSITQPPGKLSDNEMCVENYKLKPAIRIVDMTEVGSIAGTVPESLLASDERCTMDQGVYENVSVYVFEDPEGTTIPDDFDGTDDAVTSALVEWDGAEYGYEVGYLLAPETYRLALTCTPDLDNVEVDDYDPDSLDPQDFGFVDEIVRDTIIDQEVDGSFSAPPAP